MVNAFPMMLGLAAFVVLTGIFVVLEGYLLYYLEDGVLWKWILKSALLNLFSALLGISIEANQVDSGVLGFDYLVFTIAHLFTLSVGRRAVWNLLMTIPTLIFWILIERVSLIIILKGKHTRSLWQTAILLNMAS